MVRLYEVHPNNDHDCGQHPHQILEAADDAGQAVGVVDEEQWMDCLTRLVTLVLELRGGV